MTEQQSRTENSGKLERKTGTKKSEVIAFNLSTAVLPLEDAKKVLSKIEKLKADKKYSVTLEFLSELFRKLQSLEDGDNSRIEIDLSVRQYLDYKDGYQYQLTSKPKVPGCPKSKKLPARPGTASDMRRLYNTFSEIGFKVIRKENLKKWEIEREIKSTAKLDHYKFDCFLCIISSHGTVNKTYGTDGYEIIMGPLLKLFKSDSCPSLDRKPKIFLFQSCSAENGGERIPEIQEPLNDDIDFLYGYSTLPGHLAYNAKGDKIGSFYLNLLCDYLQNNSNSRDLVSILEVVNTELEDKKTQHRPNDSSSITSVCNGLRGHLFLQ